jgi:hypothetical protein
LSTTVNEAGTGAKPEAAPLKSITVAREYADAYDRVADFLAAHPDLAEHARFDGRDRFLIYAGIKGDPKDAILGFARICREAGIDVSEVASGRFGGAQAHFGPITVQCFADADQVCNRVVVGVVEDVQHALAFDLDGTPRKQVEVSA